VTPVLTGPDPTTSPESPCVDLDGHARHQDYDGDGIPRVDLGAYEHGDPNPASGEVTGLQWIDGQTLVWNITPGADEYHVYRDLLSNLSGSGTNECRDDLDPFRSDTNLFDPELPAPGTGFFYVVTAESATGEEGTLGLGTCAERSNLDPCF